MQRIKLMILTLIMTVALTVPAFAAEEQDAYNDLSQVYQLLKDYHIHDVPGETLAAEAIKAMLQAVDDRYTTYYTNEEWQAYEAAMNQHYSGVGMRLGQDNTGFYVVEVFEQSPAQNSGIHSGDYIIGVDGKSVQELTLQQLVDLIVGDEGTTVDIQVNRSGKLINFTCTRADIQVPVIYSQRFAGNIGYIELKSFNESAATAFIQAKQALETLGIEGLLIDLRGNPGGYLHIVSRIAEQFIESGVLIYQEDRHQVTEQTYIRGGQSVSYPVVLLVDENSASGSEILAGALQDYELATVIGESTYGKGYIQRLIQLSSGGYLRITIEQYLTPNQHPVHEEGISPDIEVSGHLSQLLTALHVLDQLHIELKATGHSLQVNGVSVAGFIDYVSDDDRIFVHSRQLAALHDASIVWDDINRAVVMTQGEQTTTFAVSSPHVQLLEGKTYIALDEYVTIFNDVHWTMNEDLLTITYEQRNE